jgi:hypothetical protein
VYHAFKIDRPIELYPRLMRVVAAGWKYLVSTIHHPNYRIVKYRRLHPPAGVHGRAPYSRGT